MAKHDTQSEDIIFGVVADVVPSLFGFWPLALHRGDPTAETSSPGPPTLTSPPQEEDDDECPSDEELGSAALKGDGSVWYRLVSQTS